MQYLKSEVRERILKAAIDEFREYGYQDAGIRNIANNAEISLGNIYRYFSNKEALYYAIINPFLDDIELMIERDMTLDHRTIKEVSETFIGFINAHKDELDIVSSGSRKHYQTFNDRIVAVATAKIKEVFVAEYGEKVSSPRADMFYTAIAEGFVASISHITRSNVDEEQKGKYALNIITFYFNELTARFERDAKWTAVPNHN